MIPRDGEVVCCRILLDAVDSHQLDELRKHLSSDEQKRSSAFLKPDDKKRYIVAHGALSILARQILGEEPEISVNQFGKPCFINSSLQFNLSHSGNLVLMAFSANAIVGIDVEQERVIEDLELIAKQYFHPKEAAILQKMELNDQVKGFFSCWAKKEAVIKALGLGLSMPLDAFQVEVASLFGASQVQLSGEQAKTLSLRAFQPAEGYYAAVAAPIKQMSVRFCDFNYVAMQHNSVMTPTKTRP